MGSIPEVRCRSGGEMVEEGCSGNVDRGDVAEVASCCGVCELVSREYAEVVIGPERFRLTAFRVAGNPL